MRQPIPVPEAPLKDRFLEPGKRKQIFLDREAAAKGTPCWLIYVADDKLIYRALEWSTRNVGGLNVKGRGHKDAPLFPDHAAFWVETSAAIEIFV